MNLYIVIRVSGEAINLVNSGVGPRLGVAVRMSYP